MNTEQTFEGTVAWFNATKGYGFITYTSSIGKKIDVFVHYSGIQTSGYRTLGKNAQVRFNIVNKNERECAVNVQVINAGKPQTTNSAVEAV